MDCPFMPGRFHESPPVTPITVPLSGIGSIYSTGGGAFFTGIDLGSVHTDPPWWAAYTKAVADGRIDHWHDASFMYGYEAGVQDGKKSRQTEIDSLKRAFSAADAQLDRIRDVIDEGFE